MKEYMTPYCLCFPAQSMHKCIPKYMEHQPGFFFSQSMQNWIKSRGYFVLGDGFDLMKRFVPFLACNCVVHYVAYYL